MRHKTGNDFSGGSSSFLTEPGCYHLMVTEIRDPAATSEGAPITGGAFTVKLAVLAGSVDGQVGRTIDVTFFEPNINHKDEGKFSRKKIDRFLLATNLLGRGDHDVERDFILSPCVGQQLFIGFEAQTRTGRNGQPKTFLDIHRCDIFHVDDTDIAKWPRNEEALKSIPARFRQKGGPVKPASGSSAAKHDDVPF